MVKNEDYTNLLKKMVACVSYGDYYSVKELSKLQLDNIKQVNTKIEKEVSKLNTTKELNECKEKPLEEWTNNQLVTLLNMYSNYILKKIEKTDSIKELQIMTVSIDEFIRNI